MLQEKTFAAGEVNLNYLDSGPSSAAPLVMSHGGAWRWQEYLSLTPTLGQRWHVYAVDLERPIRMGAR
jgi:pimeloyl-ACP methyl ester carboxylesterase